MTDTPIKQRVRQILDLLKGEYGVPEWQSGYDPISVLVQTILSQNTSDVLITGKTLALILDRPGLSLYYTIPRSLVSRGTIERLYVRILLNI